MPGVELAKFHQQLDHLAEQMAQPEHFVHEFRGILEFYSDRTYRAGEKIKITLRLPSYHLPRIVMQNLQQFLERKIPASDPENAVRVADLLWKEPEVESKSLAAQALGAVRSPYPTIIIRVIDDWIREPIEAGLLKELMDKGTRTLRKDFEVAWLEKITTLLISTSHRQIITGLLAILPLIQDETFDNLPKLYEMLYPVVSTPSSSVLPELMDVLSALIKCSPTETVSYLAQLINDTHHPNLLRAVRNIMPAMDTAGQARVRQLLEQEKARIRSEVSIPIEKGKDINKTLKHRPMKKAKPLV
jgi:hypothetical protein